MVLLLRFNLIFGEVSEAPSAGWKGGAGSFSSPQAVWSFPEALPRGFPASVTGNVQTTGTRAPLPPLGGLLLLKRLLGGLAFS